MSIDGTHRCGVCRSYVDDEDLFCANCGTENIVVGNAAQRIEHTASHHSFDCRSCGASMSYDASAQALRCPFCGGTQMDERQGVRSVLPEGVVPIQITRAEADAILRKWLGNGFWRPADAARAARIGEIAAVYVPYWVFEASTDTMWTADSSPAPAGSRGDWYPVSGENSSHYDGILIGGSRILTPQETASIAPFHIDSAVRPSQIDLTRSIVEEFRVPRKLARPLARAAIDRLEHVTCTRHVPNRSRNVRVNVRITSMRGYPMLLPVWILAYQYKRQVHRVLLNGQTGKIAGSAPFSYGKLVAVLLIVGALLAAIFLVLILANR